MENEQVIQHLCRIEMKLDELASERRTKEFYSTSEVAQMLQRAEFTVREWCRLGRITAQKRAAGRGLAKEWMISHEEVTRVQSEGLLPIPKIIEANN